MLDAGRAEVAEQRSARRQPLTDKDVRELLRRAGTVIVARGRKTLTLPAGKARPADLKGPSGKYRAPMLLKGKTLLVGFNAEALEALV